MKEEAKTIIIDELEALKQRIIDNINSTGTNASGRTIASLFVSITDDGGKLVSDRSGIPFFSTLETGRKPGKIPFGFADTIRQWMKDKNITANPIPYIRKASANWQPKYTPQERGEMSLAGAIAFSIRKHGSKLHQNGGRNDIYSNEIPQTIKNIREKLKGIATHEVKKSIKLN